MSGGDNGLPQNGEEPSVVHVFAYGTLQIPVVYLAAVGNLKATQAKFEELLSSMPLDSPATTETFTLLPDFCSNWAPISLASATLKGYRRNPLKERRYPGIVACCIHKPCLQCQVRGVVYQLRNPQKGLPNLEAFEGVNEGLYVRELAEVQVDGKGTVMAHLFVWNGGQEEMIVERDWEMCKAVATEEDVRDLFT